MNISFLNPLLLFGLAAVILPILIHRITQTKTVRRKFPAVHLLVQSRFIMAKPQNLKHLILLALRILAVSTLVFMMARPMFLHSGVPALHKGGARVVIFDNSLSMDYREDRGQRYDLAKKAVREALRGFDGLVALIPTVSAGDARDFPWLKAEEAINVLDTVPLSFARGDSTAALARAYRQLKLLEMPKEIIVVSDMARNDWEGLDLTGNAIIPDTNVTFLRIGGPSRDANLSIKEVSLESGGVIAGAPARLNVTLSNFSDHPVAALVKITLDGRAVDQKSININANREEKIVFDLLLDEPGRVDGEVQLTQDRLDADNVFPFTLVVNEKVKVLIVDGDPKTSLKAGESYYLVKALSPGGAAGASFLPEVITETEMSRVNLRLYDVLFLLNVAEPDFSGWAKFMETGRPMFLFLGDRIVAERYNKFSLLPWQIGKISNPAGAAGRALQVATVGGIPEVPSPFAESLKKASFRSYFKVEGTARDILTLSNHDPLLLEAETGKSRLFLFVSSADLDWNDLPLQTGYLPLIQGLVKDALGLRQKSLPGEGLTAAPALNKDPARRGQQPGKGAGLFQLHPEGANLWQGVNTLSDESDLVKITDDELKKKFGTIDARVVEYREGGLMNLEGGNKEIWPQLLFLLLLLLLTEMLIANGIPQFGLRGRP